MTLYDSPNLTTGLVGLAEYNNAITGDVFGWLLLMGIFSVIFIATSGGFTRDLKGASIASSFITLLLTILLWSIGLVADLALIVFGVLFAIIFAVLMVKS